MRLGASVCRLTVASVCLLQYKTSVYTNVGPADSFPADTFSSLVDCWEA